jgi:hypothetical protein
MYRIVLIALSLSLFSCVKKGNYTCTCSTSNVFIESVTYNNTNLKNAEDNCNTLTDKYRAADSNRQMPPVTCVVK